MLDRIGRTIFALTLVTTTLSAPRAQDASPAPSQPRATFDISSLNGIPLTGETTARPGLDFQSALSVTIEHDIAILHRIVIDHTRGLYFGYDLLATPVEGSRQIHLHFSPLSSLSSFQAIDLKDCHPGSSPAPLADATVDPGAPIIIPLERHGESTALLADTLHFGPMH
jgi:hypothetical protein